MRRSALGGTLAAVFALGMSAQAMAVTTVSRSGNTITITGGDEVNYVEQKTFGDSGPLRYRDPGGLNYTPGECADVGDFTVECGNLGPGLVVNVNLGGGDDTFRPEYTITTSPRVVADLGAGNDTSWGSAGADDLKGGPGDDTIIGMSGNDAMDGGDGGDRLTGSSGDDTITGGAGRDSLFGDGDFSGFSYGNDTLNARDGEIDALSCSFGADTAVADVNDTFDVLGDCESRDISAAQPGPAPGAGPGPDPGPGALSVALGTPRPIKLGALLAGRALSFRITFSGACATTVGLVVRAGEAKRLKIGARETVIARAVDRVPEAGTFAATLKLKSAYRKRLRRARSVTAHLVIVCTDGSGAAPSATRKVVFRR